VPGYFLALVLLQEVAGIFYNDLRLLAGGRYELAEEAVPAPGYRILVREHHQRGLIPFRQHLSRLTHLRIGGIAGFDWAIIVIALLFDLGAFGSGREAQRRRT